MEHHLRNAAKRVIKPVVYGSIYYAGHGLRDGGVTILCYHSIDDHDTDLSVPPRLFEQHMEILAAEGCRGLTMGQVAVHIRERKPFPPKSVAITFDDGFAGVAEQAAPAMARHGFPGTVYVITGMVGRVTHWHAFGQDLPPLLVMTWQQIQDLATAGWEIGAHTVHHGFLTRCSPEDLRTELVDARAELESKLGAEVRQFAYPQGDYDRRVVTATRAAGYSTAVTVDQGRARLHNDPLRLPRLFVGKNTSPTVLRSFTAPTIGPAYVVINWLIRDLARRRTWPRPNPDQIDSTGSTPIEAIQ
ncbi:MAG: polysaccharide deacetylase family protein [Chloroflexia bacterium]